MDEPNESLLTTHKNLAFKSGPGAESKGSGDDLLTFVQQETGSAVWEFDLVTQEGYWPEHITTQLGISGPFGPGKTRGVAFSDISGKPVLQHEIEQALDKGVGYDVELAIDIKGHEFWIRAIGFPETENGKVIKLRGLFQDITWQKKMKAQHQAAEKASKRKVREAAIQLDVMDKELVGLIYSVSHDLRAPIRSMDGFSIALMEDYYKELPPPARDYLSRISSAGKRLGSMIDHLLSLVDISRKASKPVTVDLSVLCEEIVAKLKPGDRYDICIEPGLTVTGDVDMTRTMMQCLLDNAIKFTSTSARPEIKVGKLPEGEGDGIMIKDNGVGFNMTYAERLFGAFHRLHKSTEFQGAGMGLAIVQRIINKHGGKVWADSQLGKGTTFCFIMNNSVV